MQGIRRRSQEPHRRSAGASLSTSSLDAVTRKSYDHKLNRPAPTCPTSKDPEDKPPVSFTSLPFLVSKASLRIPSEKPPVSYQNAYRVALRSHPYPGTRGLPQPTLSASLPDPLGPSATRFRGPYQRRGIRTEQKSAHSAADYLDKVAGAATAAPMYFSPGCTCQGRALLKPSSHVFLRKRHESELGYC